MGLVALAGLFLFWRERNKRKHLERIPEKNPNDFAGFSSAQPGYGQVQQDGMGMGGDGRPIPRIKTYEMSGERTVELPAGHRGHELGSDEYEGHGQQGVFRERM